MTEVSITNFLWVNPCFLWVFGHVVKYMHKHTQYVCASRTMCKVIMDVYPSDFSMHSFVCFIKTKIWTKLHLYLIIWREIVIFRLIMWIYHNVLVYARCARLLYTLMSLRDFFREFGDFFWLCGWVLVGFRLMCTIRNILRWAKIFL